MLADLKIQLPMLEKISYTQFCHEIKSIILSRMTEKTNQTIQQIQLNKEVRNDHHKKTIN